MLRPIGDRVLIKRKEEITRTEGGLFIPEKYVDRPAEGEVIAIGDGRILDNGREIKMRVKVGDMVLFAKFAGMEFGEGFLIVHENEILAILEE